MIPAFVASTTKVNLGNGASDLPRWVRHIRRRSTADDRNHRATRPGRRDVFATNSKTSGSRGRFRFLEPDARQAAAMLDGLDDAINQWRCLCSIREIVSQLVSSLWSALRQVEEPTSYLWRGKVGALRETFPMTRENV